MTAPKDQCEICGTTATVHLVTIADGQPTERHLCARHANDALPHAGLGQVAKGGVLENLRGAAKFLRRHGRMPESVEELLQGMADPGDCPAAHLSDPKLVEGLYFMDGLIRFYERHGRLPLSRDESASVGLDWDKTYGE